MYQVKVNQFEGPFDLLLDLIDKKKLSINEISLAEITGQYLDYLKEARNFPVREVVYFIVVAATLMLIKSRSLMPTLQFSQEEELEIQNLEMRLQEYQRFKLLARGLENIFGKRVIFAREAFLNMEVVDVFVEPKDLSVSSLEAAVKNLLERLPQKEMLPEVVVKKTVSLEQKIDELIKRFESRAKFFFSELKNVKESEKIDLIVGFLAVLELTKRGFIKVVQEKNFGEIEIIKSA